MLYKNPISYKINLSIVKLVTKTNPNKQQNVGLLSNVVNEAFKKI